MKLKKLSFFILLFMTNQVYCQTYVTPTDLKWEMIPLNAQNFDFGGAYQFTPDNHMKLSKAVSKKEFAENFSLKIRFKDAEWPALYFNAADLDNCEKIYLRTFRSGTKEAIQYVPINNGFTPWRIYGNEQAPADFKEGWNTLQIDVVNHSVYVFVNDEVKPSLIVKLLRNPSLSGLIGFGAVYGNITVDYFKFASIESDVQLSPELEKGVIDQWQVSDATNVLDRGKTVGEGIEKFSYPKQKSLNIMKWESINTDYDGILNISKYRENKDSVGHTNIVVAKTFVSSQEKGVKKMIFGFCDVAVVYVNGKLAFSGFIPLQDRTEYMRLKVGEEVPIQLDEGDNEILVISSGYDNDGKDGGWGIYAKIL